MVAVCVSNLSKAAKEEDLKNFFSFSGTISGVSIKEGDATNTAEVAFEEDTALETALLLTGAVIVDKEVTITAAGKTVDGACQPKSSAQDMVTTMLAKGFVLAQDVMAKAQAYDKKHKLSAAIISKAQDIDAKYGVSDKAKAGYQAAEAKWNEIDGKYHVKEKAGSAIAEGSKKAGELAEKALENPTVASGMDFIKRGMTSLSTKATEIKDETLSKASK